MQKNLSHKWLILITVSFFAFMDTLDGSIVNVALPVISKGLGIPMNQSEWIASIYLVTICSLLLIFGKLGDVLGKNRIFKIGMVLFTIGSFLSGFENGGLQLLLFARVIQGISASMTMATNLGIITETFPIAERGRALGITGSIAALGAITGPGIGGLLLGFLPWGYIFWINVPVGIALFVLGMFVLNKDNVTSLTTFDYLGAILLIPGLILLFGAFFIGQQIGFSDIWVIGSFCIAIALLGVFAWHEFRANNPIIDFSLFTNHQFSVSLASALFIFVTNFFFNVIMPFYLENAQKISPQTAGLVLMIFPIAQLIASPFAGAIADKIGANRLSAIGLFLLTLGQLSLVLVGHTTSLTTLAICIAVLGLGNGSFQAPNNSLSMGSVPSDKLGTAGSINAFARELGMVTGIAAATTILFSSMGHRVGYHVSGFIAGRPDVFIYGMHVVFLVSFMICLVLFIVNLVMMRKKFN